MEIRSRPGKICPNLLALEVPDDLPAPADDVLPTFDSNWALFLDVDGTLLQFADHPDDVEPHPALVPTLARVHESTSGALALVSGRDLASLDAIFSPLRLPAAGLHGNERRGSDGRTHRESAQHDAIDWVRREMQGFVDQHPGAIVEDKGAAVALHFRQTPGAFVDAEALIDKIEAELPASFCVQTGKMVFEVKPSGQSKGTAIAEFMKEPSFEGRVPVFVGDDDTDEDGFVWVNAHGGITIKVGSGTTAARFRCDSVESVMNWLEDYEAYLARRT